MYVCILDRDGKTVLHRNLPCRPEAFLAALAPFREDLVVGCECLFAWYWLADLCEREGIAFVLGHALGMRSIYGLNTKSDKLDSWKIAQLLRGGIGKILAMTLFYEVPDFDRFDTIHQFASYARLAVPPAVLGVAPRGESAGKQGSSRGRKQGNVLLKWAFSEAAVLLLRANPRAQKLHSRLVARWGKAKALSVLASKIGRAVFYMQKRKVPFDAERFYGEA